MESGAHADPFQPHTTYDDHRHSRYKNTSPIAPIANAINTGRRMMEMLDANHFIRSTFVLRAARVRVRNASPSCVGLSSLLLCTMLRNATFSIEYDLLALLCRFVLCWVCPPTGERHPQHRGVEGGPAGGHGDVGGHRGGLRVRP